MNEAEAARVQSQAHAQRLTRLLIEMPPDALADRLRAGQGDPALAHSLCDNLIETGYRIAATPAPVATLAREGIAADRFLAAAEEETDAPLLFLAARAVG